MGYLSQRKKSERENIFLKISSAVFAVLTLCSFVCVSGGVFPDLLLHFYFFNLLLFVYALYIDHWGYGGFFLLLLIVNFFHVSAFANILFDAKIEAPHHLALEYTPDSRKDLIDSDLLVLRSGHLEFGNKTRARFWALEKNAHAFNLIRVDFSDGSAAARRKSFRQLAAFIDAQDDPVILYGNFGEAAWSRNMRRFLNETGLKVKNRLIFAEKGHRFNPFALPGFYVLGFANLGVDSLRVSPSSGGEFPVVTMLLRFE